VPRTATPMVAPTCRRAEIRAEPEPLVSADRAPQRRVHRLRHGQPQAEAEHRNQAAANPVPLSTVVVAPNRG